MYLGISKIKITPQHLIRLCGYADRTSAFDGVREDIYLRVQIHKKSRKTIVFIYADLLWWGSDFVEIMKRGLSKDFALCSDDIFFVASHNHSGPPTGNSFTSTLEEYNEKYAEFLKGKVKKAVKKALGNLEEVTGALYCGKSFLNVFRRVIVDKKVEMAPNYNVNIDNNLTIVGLYKRDGSLKGLMIHYPCHANLSKENYIQPDFPGVVLGMLDKEFPNSISIFLQGCTADIRPNVVIGNKFTSCTYEQVLEFSDLFYQDCCYTLKNEPLSLDFNLKTAKKEIFVYQENLKDICEIEEMQFSELPHEREWAVKVLEKNNRNYEVLEINIINYADNISFLTYNGEISQYYSQYAKSLDERVISLGYTNGMIGYICTKEQIDEGGYEPEGSAIYFALSGTYKPEIEEIVQEGIKDLIIE